MVQDRCPKIEYGRLFGEIGWAGVNRRVISAKKGQAVQLAPRASPFTRGQEPQLARPKETVRRSTDR